MNLKILLFCVGNLNNVSVLYKIREELQGFCILNIMYMICVSYDVKDPSCRIAKMAIYPVPEKPMLLFPK